MRDQAISRLREAAKIVLFATLAAVTYGILHDMVTAHVCVEYFTIGHPPVFPTDNPALLAIGWGVIATWWVGLPLGILLAIAALVGPYPLGLRHIRSGIVKLMLVSGVVALLSGLVGMLLGMRGAFPLTESWNELLEPARMVPFAFDAWAHSASYLVGFVGGIILVALTILRRLRASTK